MKLTNFTFLRAGNAWLLKSVLPMLVFMTLSLGIEAQVQTPGDVLAERQGIDLVHDQLASQRLKAHVGQLDALNPSTREDQARKAIRMDYALFIMDGIGSTGYKYVLLNDSQTFLEGPVAKANAKAGISLKVSDFYDEMVDLLRS